MAVNLYRFMSFPNAFKFIELAFIILTMTIVGFSGAVTGRWFFWLNIIAQLISMLIIIFTFLLEIENTLTCGRDIWPLFEISYSALFFFFSAVNTFLCASSASTGNAGFGVASFFSVVLLVCFALGGVMMFRIWRGFNSSAAGPPVGLTRSTGPAPPVLPGDPGNMHPGV
ncbi:hypothetical protein L596_003172 [Steinernema carpocapsae]|uniref:MARVEL domain-containing protein n=1 Tax=Steinernema carpocapsae TaxID=34508 RepID=A0A4U8URR7_STECR|nr:hypothetical protein L596_003172 [Steinernema carpocapsae]